MQATPTETHSDLPSFVPEKDLRAALAAAQNMARQRDDLASELARLKRELDARPRGQVDDPSQGGDGLSRRVAVLREALGRKDQEILSLKSYQAGHNRQLHEARELAERLRRDRADLEERLRSREGVFAAIDREREGLTRALGDARREGDRAAQAVVQADAVVNEWRVALEATTRELDEARRQVAELRAAWESLAHERQRFVEGHAEEMVTVRAETESVRRETERLLAEAASRYDASREAHAIALRAAEDAHAEDLADERRRAEEALADERAGAEAALAEWRALSEKSNSARDWAEGMLAAVRSRLETAEADHEAVLRDAHETHARELEALRASHEAELRALRDAVDHAKGDTRELRALRDAVADAEGRARALSAECESLKARLARTEADLAEAERAVEESECNMVEVLADKDARHASTLRDLKERHEDSLRDAEACAQQSLDDARAYFTEALDAQREAHEGELLSLRDHLSGDEARVLDLERELEAAREALGHYAAESVERVLQAERAAEEAQTSRDRYARKLATTVRQTREFAQDTGAEVEAMRRQVVDLTRLVGELTARSVTQLASSLATSAGRSPEMNDVEEAVSLVSDGLPESVADPLWAAREGFYHRLRAAQA